MTKLIDTSIDFSEIETEIILLFAMDIQHNRLEKKTQESGKKSFSVYKKQTEVGISIEEDNGNRFILVCTLNLAIDKHEMSENLRNPAELKDYLNDLKTRINEN